MFKGWERPHKDMNTGKSGLLVGGGGGLWKLAPFLLANFLYVIGQNCVTGPFLNQLLLGITRLVRGTITPQDGSQ